MNALEESTLIEWLLGGLGAAWSVFLSFFLNRLAKNHDNMEQRVIRNTQELAEHKLHTSENYAKSSDVRAGLERVHDRMDEISADIKILIRENGHVGKN